MIELKFSKHFEIFLSWFAHFRTKLCTKFDDFFTWFCGLLFYTSEAAAVCFLFAIKFTTYFYGPLYNHKNSVNFVNEIFYLISPVVSIFLSEINGVVVILLS